MTEYECYHNALEQTLLSGEAMRRRLLEDARRNAERGPAADAPEGMNAGRMAGSGLRTRRLGRALLYTAAALLLCIGATLAVPSARAAVLRLLTPLVEPGAYLGTPAEQRQSVPALDAAIEDAAAKPVTVTVSQAADADWRTWAERLSVTFDELLYDGKSLYVTATLHGNAADFMRPGDEYYVARDAQGLTLSPPDDLVACEVAYTVGGKRWAARSNAFVWPDAMDDAAAYAQAVADDARPIRLTLPVGMGLTGVQELTLELIFRDIASIRSASDGDAPAQATLRIEGLTFDATAGTQAISAIPVPAPAALHGEALVFSGEEAEADGRAMVGNDTLALDGGTLAILAIRQELAGTSLTIRFAPPADWTERQCAMAAYYLSIEFVLDGENQGGFGSAYDSMRYCSSPEELAALDLADAPDVDLGRDTVFTVETSLQPEDWADMQSLALLLRIDEMRRYNGAEVPADGRVAVDVDAGGWDEETAPHRFEDCMLYVLGG